MAKYKFDKCTSVVLKGRLFEKGDDPERIFSDGEFDAAELKAAADAGFIVEVKDSKPKAKEKKKVEVDSKATK